MNGKAEENGISGSSELAYLWGRLRIAREPRDRMELVERAICATARLEAAVHQARSAATWALELGEKAPSETIERILGWRKDYR